MSTPVLLGAGGGSGSSFDGNVTVLGGTLTGITNPVTVTATDLDVRNLVFASDKVDASGSCISITGSVAVTGPLTDTQLRASAVNVSVLGTVSVSGAVSGPLTDAELRASAVNVSVSALPVDTYSAKGSTLSSSGDNTLHTPGVGSSIRLAYLCLSADGGNSADVTAIVKFTAGGSTLFKISLKPGAMWARNIGAGRRYLNGGANNALIVNLSAAQSVHASMEYQEA